MATWLGMMLTNAGIKLHADVEAGKTKLNLVKVKTGSYDHTGNLDKILDLTDLKQPKQVVDLLSKDVQGNDTYIHCAISNHDLKEAYLVRELGLFAETDSGTILYGIMIASEPDLLSAHSDSRADETIEYDIMTSISSTDKITIKQPDGSTWVNFKFLNSTMQEHNTSEQAHANLFGKVASNLENHNNDPSAHGGLLNKMNQAISDHRTMAELDHPVGSVKNKHLATESVAQINLQNRSVGSINIQTGAVGGEHIKSNAITSDHLAINSVGQRQLQGSCIDYSNIKSRGIYEDNLASACVTAYQLRDGCTTPSKLDRRYAVIEDGSSGAVDFRGMTCNQILKNYPFTFTRYGSDTKGKSAPLQWSWVLTGYGSTEVSQLGVGYDGNTERNGAYVRTGRGEQILEERPWEKLAEQSYVLKKLQDYVTKNDIAGFGIKTAVDVINALDSQTLASLGVRWLMEENGYICFGKLFGGLIIQWGNVYYNTGGGYYQKFTFPISFKKVLAITSGNLFMHNNGDDYRDMQNLTNSSVDVCGQYGKRFIFAIGF